MKFKDSNLSGEWQQNLGVFDFLNKKDFKFQEGNNQAQIFLDDEAEVTLSPTTDGRATLTFKYAIDTDADKTNRIYLTDQFTFDINTQALKGFKRDFSSSSSSPAWTKYVSALKKFSVSDLDGNVDNAHARDFFQNVGIKAQAELARQSDTPSIGIDAFNKGLNDALNNNDAGGFTSLSNALLEQSIDALGASSNLSFNYGLNLLKQSEENSSFHTDELNELRWMGWIVRTLQEGKVMEVIKELNKQNLPPSSNQALYSKLIGKIQNFYIPKRDRVFLMLFPLREISKSFIGKGYDTWMGGLSRDEFDEASSETERAWNQVEQGLISGKYERLEQAIQSTRARYLHFLTGSFKDEASGDHTHKALGSYIAIYLKAVESANTTEEIIVAAKELAGYLEAYDEAGPAYRIISTLATYPSISANLKNELTSMRDSLPTVAKLRAAINMAWDVASVAAGPAGAIGVTSTSGIGNDYVENLATSLIPFKVGKVGGALAEKAFIKSAEGTLHTTVARLTGAAINVTANAAAYTATSITLSSALHPREQQADPSSMFLSMLLTFGLLRYTNGSLQLLGVENPLIHWGARIFTLTGADYINEGLHLAEKDNSPFWAHLLENVVMDFQMTTANRGKASALEKSNREKYDQARALHEERQLNKLFEALGISEEEKKKEALTPLLLENLKEQPVEKLASYFRSIASLIKSLIDVWNLRKEEKSIFYRWVIEEGKTPEQLQKLFDDAFSGKAVLRILDGKVVIVDVPEALRGEGVRVPEGVRQLRPNVFQIAPRWWEQVGKNEGIIPLEAMQGQPNPGPTALIGARSAEAQKAHDEGKVAGIHPEYLPSTVDRAQIRIWNPGEAPNPEMFGKQIIGPHLPKANFVVTVPPEGGDHQVRLAPKLFEGQVRPEAGVKHAQIADGNHAIWAGELRGKFDSNSKLIGITFDANSGEFGRLAEGRTPAERIAIVTDLLSQATGLSPENIIYTP